MKTWLALSLTLWGCTLPPESMDASTSMDASSDTGYAWRCLELPWSRPHSVVVAQIDSQIWFFAATPIESWRVDVVAARWSEERGFWDQATVAQLHTMYFPDLSWNGALLIDYSALGSDQSTLLVYHPSWAAPTQVLYAAYSRRPDVAVGAFSGDQAWVLRDTPYLDNSHINCASLTPELFRAAPDGSVGPLCPFESPLVDVTAGADKAFGNVLIDLHPTQRALTRPGCDFGLFEHDGGLSQCIDAGMPAGEWRRFWPSSPGSLTLVSTVIGPVPGRQMQRVVGLKLWTTDGGPVSETWLGDDGLYGFRDIRAVDAGVLVLSTRAPRGDDGIVWRSAMAPRTPAAYLFSADGRRLLRSIDVTMPDVLLRSAAEDEKGIILFGTDYLSDADESICYFRL
jgi:hypothetical protein